MYSLTAIGFHHGDWFNAPQDMYNLAGPTWTKVETWPCAIDVPREGPVPRDVAAQLVSAAGMKAEAFNAFRLGGQQVFVSLSDFWTIRRLAYDPAKQELTLHSRKPVAQTIMTLMHSRAGYFHDSYLHDLWAVMVDVTVVGILIWVATGLYMWWQQKAMRWLGRGCPGRRTCHILLVCGCAMIGCRTRRVQKLGCRHRSAQNG